MTQIFLIILRPPTSTLFPYTTLFRSYLPRASTGWHTHPGPVLITVLQGTVTFYEYDDPTCTPKVVTVGQGYVDDGHGHIWREPDRAARAGRLRDPRPRGIGVPR